MSVQRNSHHVLLDIWPGQWRPPNRDDLRLVVFCSTGVESSWNFIRRRWSTLAWMPADLAADAAAYDPARVRIIRRADEERVSFTLMMGSDGAPHLWTPYLRATEPDGRRALT